MKTHRPRWTGHIHHTHTSSLDDPKQIQKFKKYELENMKEQGGCTQTTMTMMIGSNPIKFLRDK